MSNTELELIRTERLKKTCQIDWRCFIHQIELKRNLAESIFKKSQVHIFYSFSTLHSFNSWSVLRREIQKNLDRTT